MGMALFSYSIYALILHATHRLRMKSVTSYYSYVLLEEWLHVTSYSPRSWKADCRKHEALKWGIWISEASGPELIFSSWCWKNILSLVPLE